MFTHLEEDDVRGVLAEKIGEQLWVLVDKAAKSSDVPRYHLQKSTNQAEM